MALERLEEIRDLRLKKRQQLIAAGKPPYPSEARRTHTVAEALKNFSSLSTDKQAIMLTGRVMAVRAHGGVIFIDLHDQSGAIQLQANKKTLAEAEFSQVKALDSGDFVQVAGFLTKTQRGVETVEITEITLISKAIRPLPDNWYGLKDIETRYRQREVDLLMNPAVRSVFETKAKTISALRAYLEKEGFTEVETPVLQSIAGGAAAKPFTTHHNALDMSLTLRIAPELYLKRLLVGGFEKVYEIGRNFRNEGISRQHNPEFTMLEFYWAYADYEDLMDFTEHLLQTITKAITGNMETAWQDTQLNWKSITRQRYVDIVSDRLDLNILEEKDPNAYLEIFKREGLEAPTVRTYAKVVDELYKALVRPGIVQPTILYDYPVEMVPLAKTSLADSRIAEMFQLVVAGTELVKAYSELNDPVIQRERFEEQQKARAAGDEEMPPIDESYIRALEYGMPPAGGLGLGVDRLIMLLTNTSNLRDTILFPLLKNE
ncbi:MAG: lysine--tRNA ligase [Candidatus Andersenbacteria bacterium]|nr:lysine--tRNA ligase [Candidatus Andersenbacteria bacterium]MBI3250345.1 lysine--tRNA ligase [Candidatus Andersenbacteria bacterium]